MDLRWPGLALGLAVAVGTLLVVWTIAWRRGPRRSDVLLAHAERIRALPRFQQLARRQLWAAVLRTIAVLAVVGGSVLLAGRPQTVSAEAAERRSRDIMLCLDASGSMSEWNVEVVREMRRVVAGLEGDRIGLTVFSGAAVPIFPLTDDYEFVLDQLDQAEDAFEVEDYDYVAGIQIADDRASQLGDGIVSCAQRFDLPDQDRSRVVIVASDNDPQGPPVFTPTEAGQYAAERGVVVHAIGSPEMEGRTEAIEEFRSSAEETGGTFAILGREGSAEAIVDDIDRLERSKLESPPRLRVQERPRVGTAIAGAGLVALVAAGFLGRRR